MREAGATAAQELAFTLADAIAYVEAAVARGLDVDDFAGRLSASSSPPGRSCSRRSPSSGSPAGCGRRSCASGSGRPNPRSMVCRFHVQTAGSSLTAQSIDNNVVRTTIQALAAVLGGAQSLHTNSRDEALALPTEEAARLALRTQQILAYEAGVTETPDPLAGSYYVESLTNELEAAAWAYLDEIEAMGGTLAAIEGGFQQRQIQEAAYRVQRAIESGDQVVVGVNRFRDDEVHTPAAPADRPGRRAPPGRAGPAGPGRALGGGLDGGDGPSWSAVARGRRQPDAADPRRGPGLRHGRRDQRPPAGRLGRAPRAHHGLTPSGRRQRGCQRPSAVLDQHLERATRRRRTAAPRSASAAIVVERRRRADSVDRQVRDDLRRTRRRTAGSPGSAPTTAVGQRRERRRTARARDRRRSGTGRPGANAHVERLDARRDRGQRRGGPPASRPSAGRNGKRIVTWAGTPDARGPVPAAPQPRERRRDRDADDDARSQARSTAMADRVRWRR